MVGIVSYGAYVPMLRLPLGPRKDGAPGPEEQSPTGTRTRSPWPSRRPSTACAASTGATVDGVLFASTSYAFKEKQGAAMIAKALDLRRDVQTADVGDSLRAGTSALRAAVDAVQGRARARASWWWPATSAWRRRGRALEAQPRRRRPRRSWSAPTTSRSRSMRARGRRRDRRRLAHRGRSVRAHVGGPLRRRPRLPRQRERGGAGLLEKTGLERRGLRPPRAVTGPTRAATARCRASSASTRRRSCRIRSSASSATPAPRSRRCCSRRPSRAPRPASACCWSATATAPTRSRSSATPASRTARGRGAASLAPGAPRRAAELRHVPALPPAARDRARSPRRRRPVGDQALPRPRLATSACSAQKCRVAARRSSRASASASPASRRTSSTIGAPVGPSRHGQVLHLRQLRRQPEPADGRGHRATSTVRASTCR